ncbi:MAG: hypothetical protein LBT10_06715 [Methanobrevibacter sp.]|jgi:hypothetical protein|nr:hypothetical protein [Methanobrevibacter sp.]
MVKKAQTNIINKYLKNELKIYNEDGSEKYIIEEEQEILKAIKKSD